MRLWLGSIKPASHGVTERGAADRHEALGQAVFNMRDYTRA